MKEPLSRGAALEGTTSARRLLVNDSRVARPYWYLPSLYYTSTKTKVPRTNMIMGFRRLKSSEPPRTFTFAVRGGRF